MKLLLWPSLKFPPQICVCITALIPQCIHAFAKGALKYVLVLFSSYNALAIMADLPASFPNSKPNNLHILPLLDVMRKALHMSAALTSRSHNSAIVEEVCTVSMVTTLDVMTYYIWVT